MFPVAIDFFPVILNVRWLYWWLCHSLPRVCNIKTFIAFCWFMLTTRQIDRYVSDCFMFVINWPEICQTASTGHLLRLFDNYAHSALNIFKTRALWTNNKTNAKNTIQICLRQENVITRAKTRIEGFCESIHCFECRLILSRGWCRRQVVVRQWDSCRGTQWWKGTGRDAEHTDRERRFSDELKETRFGEFGLEGHIQINTLDTV